MALLKQIEFDFTNDSDSVVKKNKNTESKFAVRRKGKGRLSLKQMEQSLDWINIPPDEELFSKKYYTIGKVAEMLNANITQIRFWENHFDELKPLKNKKGNRLFRPEDVKTLEKICYLLRQKKYTIQGVKDYFKSVNLSDQKLSLIKELEQIKLFLLELKANL